MEEKASNLLNELETYNFTEIFSQFSKFLKPFSRLTSQKTSKKPAQYSIAQAYISFVKKWISLLPKRLLESPRNPKTIEYVSQLFQCYKLCLDCLDTIDSEQFNSPYCVELQRDRYVHCLMKWEMYEDGIEEGFRVLKRLSRVRVRVRVDDGCGWEVTMGEFVPRLVDNGNGDVDGNFVHLIVDLVVVILQCVSLSHCKDAQKYTALLTLLHEVRPWFRILEACSSRKLQRILLTHLKNVALFLVREATHFEADLVSSFCAAVFNEYTQFLNVQGTTKEELNNFLHFLSCCTYECRSACKHVRDSVAMCVYSSAGNFSQDLVYVVFIQRLYALGLYFSEFSFEPNSCLPSEGARGIASASFSSEGWEKLQDLSALLSYGKKYYPSYLGDYEQPSHEHSGFVLKASLYSRSDCEAFESCKSTNGEEYITSYLDALKYLCLPLSDFIHSERKSIVMEDRDSPLGNALNVIFEAFLQYCQLFLHCKQHQKFCVRINKTLLSISVATFTLSVKLNLRFEESTSLLNYMLCDKCISLLSPQLLKSVITMIYNSFVEFYKCEQFKEASKILELCCKASWSRCLLFCEILVGKQKGFSGELSENMIVESMNEACKHTSLLMVTINKFDSCTVEKVFECGLEKWCFAKNLWEHLPSPGALIQKWAEIQCKNPEDFGPILGNYVFHSLRMVKNNISLAIVETFLEQELLAYEELSNFHPMFSQKMQMEIIEILLHKVYLSTKYMKRSRILVKKGMLSRISEDGGPYSCVQCLSEAIELINGSPDMIPDIDGNQLAIMYCLHALSTHEVNPTSKEIFEDVRKAVNIWLQIGIPGYSSFENCDLGSRYILVLLYHVADLLSIKGDTTLHSNVLIVIIKVLKQMNIPLKKCLLDLWKSRRVNHALCVVPTNEAFVMALSEHYGKDVESIDFWISNFEDSEPLSVGLQQNFFFISSLFPLAFNKHKHCLQSEISVDEVKSLALNLVSNVSVLSCSTYLAGYIYHDLTERLCANGRMVEALFCANKAATLRGKLLKEHFSFSFLPSGCVSKFLLLKEAAVRAWPSNAVSQGSDDVVLTPWNVLRCYLESILQVGVLYEKLGNVTEAKAHFILGKNIAYLQNLPQFIVSFSSCLGKVYNGLNQFDLAKQELATSHQVLGVMCNSLTCSRCSLVLQSSISEELGYLYRKGVSCASENPYELSLQNLISLEKGDLSVWLEGASAEYSKLGEKVNQNSESWNRTDHECAEAIASLNNFSESVKTRSKMEAKRSRKTKKDPESQVTVKSCATDQKLTTRSRKLPSHGIRTDSVKPVGNGSNSYFDGKLKSETLVISNQVVCQKCFSSKRNFLGSFIFLIEMKWEFVRRRQILRLLIGLGNCGKGVVDAHKTHIIYSKCISILLGGNDCHCSSSTLCELNVAGHEIPGDIFVAERAEVLYNLSRLSLTALYSKDIRNRSPCSNLHYFQMSNVVSFLLISFVLSREIPLLFQKVSRLLALTYVISATKEKLSSLSCNVFSENYWAAYFHQVSVGIYHNLQLLSDFTVNNRSHVAYGVKGYETPVETSMIAETCKLLRMVPESTEDIESYVGKFFENLPSTTIVCVSLLGASYATLLEDLMYSPSGVCGWMLLSHLNADSQPAVVLLPLSTISQEEETSFRIGENYVQKEWCSPWGCNNLVDAIAPLFKLIMQGNYSSSSNIPEEDTQRNCEIRWTWRENLDKCLHKFLLDMEETWFGQWKYLLLGRCLDAELLNCVVKEIIHELKKNGHEIAFNENILKVVMGGIKSTKMGKVRVPRLFLEKGCYMGNIIGCDQETCDTLDEKYDGLDGLSDSLIAAVNKVELGYCTRTGPVVFVLDSDIQMLPLESMPFMREQEVYRMPSVASIFLALRRRSVLNEAAKLGTQFPMIDPLDAFYVLNPSGDLNRTQAEFEEWFRDQNMQGKAGCKPSPEELSAALEKHDLFLYFGHGNGEQYMHRDMIKKLQSCSASLLMGCSSGCLNLNGRYAPVGISLSYMMAGAPIVVANLWEVTDLDIDRFAKAVLKSFLEERSMFSKGCTQCSLATELKSMRVNGRKGNVKKGRGKKKAADPIPDVSDEHCFRHKFRVGYFVSQARKACRFPFLIGAAPVCYGVPTGIRKKREI